MLSWFELWTKHIIYYFIIFPKLLPRNPGIGRIDYIYVRMNVGCPCRRRRCSTFQRGLAHHARSRSGSLGVRRQVCRKSFLELMADLRSRAPTLSHHQASGHISISDLHRPTRPRVAPGNVLKGREPVIRGYSGLLWWGFVVVNYERTAGWSNNSFLLVGFVFRFSLSFTLARILEIANPKV